MSLTAEQVGQLTKPLHPSRVKQLRGQAHLEAWDVRRYLLRIFGWGGWDFHVVTCDLVHESISQGEGGKPRATVVYRVVGRLTIRDLDGCLVAEFEDGATGDGVNQPSVGDAHDLALKSAMSQALKRCAVNLGDAFGLSLYADGRTDAVVLRTVGAGHTPVVDVPA